MRAGWALLALTLTLSACASSSTRHPTATPSGSPRTTSAASTARETEIAGTCLRIAAGDLSAYSHCLADNGVSLGSNPSLARCAEGAATEQQLVDCVHKAAG
jgi:hypothetical protein